MWILIEQTGPWGHSALVESRLDRRVGAELQARTKGLGIKALLVKSPGGSSGARRCFLGRSDQPAPFLDEHELDGDDDLLALDLEALAHGERPAGGRPVGGPLYLVCTNSRRDACCARSLRGREGVWYYQGGAHPLGVCVFSFKVFVAAAAAHCR